VFCYSRGACQTLRLASRALPPLGPASLRLGGGGAALNAAKTGLDEAVAPIDAACAEVTRLNATIAKMVLNPPWPHSIQAGAGWRGAGSGLAPNGARRSQISAGYLKVNDEPAAAARGSVVVATAYMDEAERSLRAPALMNTLSRPKISRAVSAISRRLTT
jgi:hypothetical protein